MQNLCAQRDFCSDFGTRLVRTFTVCKDASSSWAIPKEALSLDGAGGESQNVERKLALLLVNADMRLGMVCNQAAKKIDCELRIANDWESIFSDVSSGTVTAVLVDADSTPSCTELIKRIKENSARVEVLVAGTNPPISTAVEAIRSGASDYLEKPLQADVVEQALIEAFNATAVLRPWLCRSKKWRNRQYATPWRRQRATK